MLFCCKIAANASASRRGVGEKLFLALFIGIKFIWQRSPFNNFARAFACAGVSFSPFERAYSKVRRRRVIWA